MLILFPLLINDRIRDVSGRRRPCMAMLSPQLPAIGGPDRLGSAVQSEGSLGRVILRVQFGLLLQTVTPDSKLRLRIQTNGPFRYPYP